MEQPSKTQGEETQTKSFNAEPQHDDNNLVKSQTVEIHSL